MKILIRCKGANLIQFLVWNSEEWVTETMKLRDSRGVVGGDSLGQQRLPESQLEKELCCLSSRWLRGGGGGWGAVLSMMGNLCSGPSSATHLLRCLVPLITEPALLITSSTLVQCTGPNRMTEWTPRCTLKDLPVDEVVFNKIQIVFSSNRLMLADICCTSYSTRLVKMMEVANNTSMNTKK